MRAICIGVVVLLTFPSLIALGQKTGGQSDETNHRNEDILSRETEPENNQLYSVGRFNLQYHTQRKGQVPLSELEGMSMTFGKTEKGLTAPHQADERFQWTLGSPPDQTYDLSPEAINYAGSRILEELNQRGLIGVYVRVSPTNICPQTADDLRDDSTLDFVIYTTSIAQVRTVASGQRFENETEKANLDAHQKIIDRSPLKEGDTLRERELDNYAVRLSQHPRRYVSTTLAAADQPGQAELDYKIYEDRPWLAYFQLSNTGTESTNETQQRFGVSHTQLTGRDDILNLDYITSGFDEVHFVLGSYQIPVKWLQSNLRTYGRWNRYKAADVGVWEREFKGEGWQAGTELNWNLYQRGELFVNLFGGARWEESKVKQPVPDAQWHREPFFLPYAGIEFERYTRTKQFNLTLDVERNSSSVANTDEDGIDELGRLDSDIDWTIMNLRARHAMFLEPLFRGDNFDNPDDPSTSTLAHNLALELTGQTVFNDKRLTPSAKRSIGGTYTVRGYPESAVSGDDALVMRAEYRYHLPRALEPSPEPGRIPLFGRPFRFAPQNVYGQADWDLALMVFCDYGRTLNNQRTAFELNRTLFGAGVGAEFDLLRSLKLRLEWGRALESLRDQNDEIDVKRGNQELHFGLTLMF